MAKSKTSKKPAKCSWIGRFAKAVFRPQRITLLAIAAGLPFWGPPLKQWLPDLSLREEYQLDSSQISIEREPPHWIPHNLVEQVVQSAKLPEKFSLLDPNINAQIAEAFREHPWVDDVISVRKMTFPARINVLLSYREPVALVEQKTVFVPIDARGVLLPSEDFSLADRGEYLKIKGVRSFPYGSQGELWNDPLVQGAARIAALLKDQEKSLNVASIEVPRRTTKSADLETAIYCLHSPGGSRILWGKAPGITHSGELTAARKVEQLRQYLEEYGNYEFPSGPYEIDIRFKRRILRQKKLADNRLAPLQ